MKKEKAVLSFLFRLAEDCVDKMPDHKEVHFPFHQRKEIYRILLTKFKQLYPDVVPAVPQYFRHVLKDNCPFYKAMKTQRFSTCKVCDQIRCGLSETVLKGQSTENLKTVSYTHLTLPTILLV